MLESRNTAFIQHMYKARREPQEERLAPLSPLGYDFVTPFFPRKPPPLRFRHSSGAKRLWRGARDHAAATDRLARCAGCFASTAHRGFTSTMRRTEPIAALGPMRCP
eukprot:8636324-Pyramimonas_sp.AAC.1